MSPEDITRGIAVVGMQTAARQLLDAAAKMRTDSHGAIALLEDAIECAKTALRTVEPTAAGTDV